MKNAILAAVSALLIPFACTAQAIITDSSDPISYDPSDLPALVGVLDQSNTWMTIGFILDYSVAFCLTVSPPAGIDLYALLTTRPDFSGATTINPNIYSTVYEGTSVTFPIDSSYIQGPSQSLSLQLDDPSHSSNGPLIFRNVAANSTAHASAAVCLFGGSLLGVIGVSRRRKNT